MSEVQYEASRWQSDFHQLTVDEALGAGAAGPGKTECLLMDPITKVYQEHQRCSDPNHPYPLEWGRSRGWAIYLRRTMPMLQNTLSRAHVRFRSIDPNVHWDGNDHIFTFSSGYKYQFGHCKNPDDHINYLSQEYDHILYDELVQFEEEQYVQINKRLRSIDPVLMHQLKVRAMSNPLAQREGMETIRLKNPNWVRDYFVKPAPEGNTILEKVITLGSGEKVTRTRIYLPAKLSDNPNKAFVRQYEINLQDSPEHIRQAYLFGNWDALVGGFFADVWNKRIHVVRPFRIPDHWPRFRSMDWGFKAPGCVHWWALDDDDNLICEDEFKFNGGAVNMTAKQVAKRIHVIEKAKGLWDGKRSTITGPADTQLWEQRGDSTLSKADEMAKEGVFWTKADKKSRARNAERLYERLADHEGGTETPGLVFFERCRYIIETLPLMQHDPEANPPEPMDGGDDHAADSAFYACAFASHGRRGIPKRKIPKPDWADEEGDERPTRVAQRGRDGYGGS